MRGEHQARHTPVPTARGSSPHARGTLAFYRALKYSAGIIPACAGNTMPGVVSCQRCRDHPRMRGEHGERLTSLIPPSGSSPHARGTPVCGGIPTWAPGIIPACAGNTSPARDSRKRPRDHPRMRGEHAISLAIAPMIRGSSPHARGTRFVSIPLVSASGIIPACAGNTFEKALTNFTIRDHPRMRGEHTTFISEPTSRRGSSPHARGTPVVFVVDVDAFGIIPACAGNTV